MSGNPTAPRQPPAPPAAADPPFAPSEQDVAEDPKEGSKTPFSMGLDFLRGLGHSERRTNKDGKTPKRRGPKPDSRPALTRRQELNRQAQRTHRERKETYIKTLEDQILKLKEVYTGSVQEKNTVIDENRRLREILRMNGILIPHESVEQSQSTAFDSGVGAGDSGAGPSTAGFDFSQPQAFGLQSQPFPQTTGRSDFDDLGIFGPQGQLSVPPPPQQQQHHHLQQPSHAHRPHQSQRALSQPPRLGEHPASQEYQLAHRGRVHGRAGAEQLVGGTGGGEGSENALDYDELGVDFVLASVPHRGDDGGHPSGYPSAF